MIKRLEDAKKIILQRASTLIETSTIIGRLDLRSKYLWIDDLVMLIG